MKDKQLFLVVGDCVVFFISLGMALLLRPGFFTFSWEQGGIFSSVILSIWLCVFYFFDLYDIRTLRNSYDLVRSLALAAAWATLLSILPFYFFPLPITPKINLFVFGAMVFLFACAWRLSFHLATGKPRRKALVIGSAPEIEELVSFLKKNPHVGYEVIEHMRDFPLLSKKEFSDDIERKKITSLFVHSPRAESFENKEKIAAALSLGAEVKDVEEVVEVLLKKLVILESSSRQLLRILSLNRKTYAVIKRMAELVLTLTLLGVLAPVFALISLCILFTTGRPVFYNQRRLGKKSAPFVMHKFRTMVLGAEAGGPVWAQTRDPRATRLGRFLRRTHLDELPQLFNIVKGEMSFIGPRPERPEFKETLEAYIPFYDYRHLVRPGIAGWAQINYPYGASIEDAFEKLRYDLYYIKNCSWTLDGIILIRSIKYLFLESPSKDQ